MDARAQCQLGSGVSCFASDNGYFNVCIKLINFINTAIFYVYKITIFGLIYSHAQELSWGC